MTTFNLKYFGELNLKDLTSLEKSLYSKAIYKEKTIGFFLDVEASQLNEPILNNVQSILEKLENFDELNTRFLKDAFASNSKEGSNIRYYINSLFEDYEEQLDDYINFELNIPPPIQILNKLHLIGVGIDPFSEESQLIFDYTIDENLTNDLLVLRLNLKTRDTQVDIES